MPLTSLKFRPGINREITSYSNEGGYFDCEKDELIAIKSITSSLKKNGILIIDFLNIIKVKNQKI